MRNGSMSGDQPEAQGRSVESAKRRRTRGALIDAAHTVFSAHGFGAATIEQITQAAGFTRGAFYSNFASKEELMLAAIDHERELATARMSRYIERVSDDDSDDEFTIHQLTATLVEVLQIGTMSREWQLALMEALPATLRDPALVERQLQIRARAEADTRLLMFQGLERLERRPTIENDLLVLLVLGLVERIRTDTVLESNLEAFPERAGAAIAALLMHASEPVDS